MIDVLLLFVLVTILAGVVGGALAGLKLAAADLGAQLAWMMGGFYGTIVAVPSAIITAAILYFTHQG